MRILFASCLALLLAVPVLAEDAGKGAKLKKKIEQKAPPPPKASDEDAKKAVDELKEAAKGKDVDALKRAISACGEVPHLTTAAAVAAYVTDPSEETAVEAAEALGRMVAIPEALKALHAAIKPNEERSKAIAEVFSSIEAFNSASSVAVCQGFVEHHFGGADYKDFPGIDAAIACLGGLKHKASVEALISLWKKISVSNRAGAGNGILKTGARIDVALARLTGEKFETADAWDHWWDDHKGEFKDDLEKK